MDHEKKLNFVLKMTKHALDSLPKDQHFDGGGVVDNTKGGILGIPGALTVQNDFSASAPTSSQTVGQQQAGLAAQLQSEAAGSGPNPAQLMLNKNAQTIAQGQAQQNASNRAINPGLAARLSGNEAATAGANATANASIQNEERQIAAEQQLAGLTGQEQSGLRDANSINANVSQNNANAVNNEQQGLIGGLSSAASFIGGLFAGGGMVKAPEMMAEGGALTVPPANTYYDNSPAPGVPVMSPDDEPKSGIGKILGGIKPPGLGAGASEGTMAGGAADAGGVSGLADLAILAAHGGKMPDVGQKLKSGGKVPGKPMVDHDAYRNDVVSAKLSPGEVVIDLNTLKDKGKLGQMARFVAQNIERKKAGRKLV